jgi:hypothetical protein
MVLVPSVITSRWAAEYRLRHVGQLGAYGVARRVPCSDANFGYHGSVLSQTFIPKSRGTSKVVKTRDGIDVAARYFVYKLYEATDGQPMQWQLPDGVRIAPPSACSARP